MEHLFEHMTVPVALLEPDGLTIRWANRCLREWIPGLGVGDSIATHVAPFTARRATRALERGRAHYVAAEALDKRGHNRNVDYHRHPVLLDGEALWLLEGYDRSKAQVVQSLLDTHARTIERNNRLLATRERQLEQTTEQMRRVLDNTNQGMFVVDMNGVVGSERSRACSAWFGDDEAPLASEYMGSFDEKAGAWFDLAFDAVAQGMLPPDFTIPQLPTRLEGTKTQLEVDYAPIFDSDEELTHVLVVVSDITDHLAAERAKEKERDVVELTRRLLRDRTGLEQFFEEIESLLVKLREPSIDLVSCKRFLHTIKGNCALFGATAFAARCHEIESGVEADAAVPKAETVAALKREWENMMSPIKQMLESSDRSVVELTDSELSGFVALVDGASPEQMKAVARSWRNPPVRNMLALLGEQSARIALRLNKEVDIVIRDNGLRLPLKAWRPFWSALVHVLRNALDHGMEMPDDRVANNKSRRGLITLEASVDKEEVILRFTDDGPGINWPKVEAKYFERVGSGPKPSRAVLTQELLRNGFSSRQEVSELSGRGVGLDAVAHACASVGGKMDVISEPGEGTQFIFRFDDPELVKMVGASCLAHAPDSRGMLGANESRDVVKAA